MNEMKICNSNAIAALTLQIFQLLADPYPVFAQDSQSGDGNIIGNFNTVTINKGVSDELKVALIDIDLPRNNNREFGFDVEFNGIDIESEIVSIFDKLYALNGEFVYIRFYTYVGAGFGLDEVSAAEATRAGVVFDLKHYVDGFGGNLDDYEYGYAVELNEYRTEWEDSRNSIILFPKSGSAFFDVNYMKSMRFEGLARIKVSGMQGNSFVEIVPAIPVGSLVAQYEKLQKQVVELYGSRPSTDF